MLNDERTELRVFHHKTSEYIEIPKAVVVGGSIITSAKITRNLGVIFDTIATLALNKRVTNMSRAAAHIIIGDELQMATMQPPSPHLNENKFFWEPWDILNTKSNVNIENIGMQTLF